MDGLIEILFDVLVEDILFVLIFELEGFPELMIGLIIPSPLWEYKFTFGACCEVDTGIEEYLLEGF